MTYSPKALLIPAFLFGFVAASPALADCAADIELVKSVAPSVELSDEDKARVAIATEAAAAKQAVGDEEGCIEELQAAKVVLNME